MSSETAATEATTSKASASPYQSPSAAQESGNRSSGVSVETPKTTNLSRGHPSAASASSAASSSNSSGGASANAASSLNSTEARPPAGGGGSESAHGFDSEWIELQKLQDMQEDAEFGSLLPHSESGSAASASGAAASADDADQRSVYVGNVDYSCTPSDLHEHFKVCGQINRITIMVDKYTGHPKGYAYIEFNSEAAAQNALLLTDSSLKDRQLKVVSKRKNIPGLSRGRGASGGLPSWRGGRGALHRGRGRGVPGSYRPIYRGRGGLARGYGRPYYAD